MPAATLGFALLLGALWCLSSTIFDFENSWVLFLYRVGAPILFILAGGLLTLTWAAYRLGAKFNSKKAALIISVALVTFAAPIASSLRHIPRDTSNTNLVAASPPKVGRLSLTDKEPLLDAKRETFSLFNFNALGFKDLSEMVIAEIAHRNPDVVTLQELNPILATAISKHFASIYKCMILKPVNGSSGMGFISKFECKNLDLPTTENWVGPPQIVEINLSSTKRVVVVNIHAVHPHAALVNPYPGLKNSQKKTWWSSLSQTVLDREDSLQKTLATLRGLSPAGIIIAGDLNATMRNRAYALVREAGFLDTWLTLQKSYNGGTWPSSDFIRIPMLAWLLRLDFILYKGPLIPLKVELLPDKLGSDHRGLFASFAHEDPQSPEL